MPAGPLFNDVFPAGNGEGSAGQRAGPQVSCACRGEGFVCRWRVRPAFLPDSGEPGGGGMMPIPFPQTSQGRAHGATFSRPAVSFSRRRRAEGRTCSRERRPERPVSYIGKRGGGGTGGLPLREGLLGRLGLERLLGGEGLLGRLGLERLPGGEGRERRLGGEGRREGRLLREGGLAARASLTEKSAGAVYTTPAAARAASTRRRCFLKLSLRDVFWLFIVIPHV